MADDQLKDLATRLRDFSDEREWDKFHSPKNLAMALAGEAGELLAEFQWLTEDQSRGLDPERLVRVKQEAADVLLYLVRLSDKLGFDLWQACVDKIEINAKRYPLARSKGSARKYTEYGVRLMIGTAA